jgi:hypothetical protein
MNVVIQRLNGLWHLIVGSCQFRTPFLERTGSWSLPTPGEFTLAPRSSNATNLDSDALERM